MWLWLQIEKFFIAQWLHIWDVFIEKLGDVYKAFKTVVTGKEGKDWDGILHESVDILSERLGIDKSELDFLYQWVKFPFPSDLVATQSAIIFIYLFHLKNTLDSIATKNQWEANQVVRPSLLDPRILAQFLLFYPSGENEDLVRTYMQYFGLDDTQQDILISTLRNFPSPEQLMELRNREHIDDTGFLNILNQVGYTTEDAEKLLRLRQFYPSVQDLVMMAGRDQFEPETIEKFELQRDLPQELLDAASKAGVSEEWVRKFWGAHWFTPSIQQAFEMVHRDVLDIDDLDIFYDLADIAPFFRDRLRQIAFMPYTRVDVRRMHALKVISDAELLRAYKDLGYDELHAQKMVTWTIKYNAEADRDLTLSQITKLYLYGLFKDDLEFLDYLQAIDYSEAEAWFIKDIIDYEESEREHKATLKRVQSLYKKNALLPDDVYAELGKIGVNAKRIGEYLTLWTSEKREVVELPSKTDLNSWYLEDHIDIERYRTGLEELGYRLDDILIYIQHIELQKGS